MMKKTGIIVLCSTLIVLLGWAQRTESGDHSPNSFGAALSAAASDMTLSISPKNALKLSSKKIKGNLPSVTVTEAEAKKIALDHAKLSESEVVFTKVKLDYDHGTVEYEIKFTANCTKYEYEINAESGAIKEFSSKQIKVSGTTSIDSSSVTVTEAEAKKIALDHAKLSESEVVFTKVKLYHDHGTVEYEIKFTANGTKYEYEINAESGAVKEFSVKKVKAQSGLPAGSTSVTITEAEAKKIALDHAKLSESEVIFTKVKLDHDHGTVEYEIKFTANGTKYKYEINAESGAVTKMKIG